MQHGFCISSTVSCESVYGQNMPFDGKQRKVSHDFSQSLMETMCRQNEKLCFLFEFHENKYFHWVWSNGKTICFSFPPVKLNE